LKISLDISKLLLYTMGMKRKNTDHRAKAIGEYIKTSGASIREVAIKIGVTDATIYNWLRGDKISRLALGPVDRFLKRVAAELDHKIKREIK
jgi:transposase